MARRTALETETALWLALDVSSLGLTDNQLLRLFAWIPNSRWDRLTAAEQDSLTKICPDFVIELRSKSDRIGKIKEKMEEYMANGARLGWLLDPIQNVASIYRPGQPVQEIDEPAILNG